MPSDVRSLHKFFSASSLGLALSLCAAPVLSAPADTAAAIQQQNAAANQRRLDEIDQANQIRQTGDPVLAAPIQRADLPPAGGPTIRLKTVSFEPKSAFLSDAELDAITARYVGKTLDFSQIAALVRDINDLYAEKGVVTAAAVLPPQTLANGKLEVQLVEGRLGAAVTVGEHTTKDGYIFDRLALTTMVDVVDVPGAAKDIAWFNRTNRAQLRLLLQPGASFGLTDIAIGITEPVSPLFQFWLDNEGVHSTGDMEWGTSLSSYGMLGLDDTLLLYLTGSEGSLSGTGSYSVPVTTSGTRLAVSYTQSSMKVINGPTAPLNITGASRAITASVSQPLIADTNWLVQAVVSGSYGVSSSKSGNTLLVDSQTQKAVAGLTFGYSSDRVSLTVQPQLVFAHAENLIAKSFENITLATITGSGIVRLDSGFSITARGAAQFTDAKLLPGGLLFQIGGPSTVRGYPSDGVAGDTGYYGQLEIHKSFEDSLPGLDIFAFVDGGEVFSTFPERTSLLSGGAGLSWSFGDHLTADLTVAAPLVNAVSNQSDFAVYARLTGKAF